MKATGTTDTGSGDASNRAAGSPTSTSTAAISSRHLRLGWWALLLFLTLGIGLEALHGFKVGWYLGVSSQTRRLMWTLAHAHGVLIAIVHVVFGLTLRAHGLDAGHRSSGSKDAGWARLAGACLTAALVLLPGGFFLGGVYTYGGDPGLGALLVPVGGLALFAGVFVTARHVRA